MKMFVRMITGSAIIIILILTYAACEKEEPGDGFSAGFSYTFKDDNHVIFTNESEGEYYSLSWDFGNGETETTTRKNQTFEVYYPEAGDYEVSLKVLDFVGNNKTVSKTITISSTDLVVSFTIDVDPETPNYVTLKNTTQGNYDSFSWLYRDREVFDEIETVAYFPFSGNYEIELKIVKNDNSFSHKKNIVISQDDPAYNDKFKLVWADEFNDPQINTNNWTFETGASGWGNKELQNYTSGQNAEIIDGKLVITAKKVDENKQVGSYTSARMITENKQEFQYGRIEVRAKLPSGTGVWPAIWMLGSNFRTAGWPACGEMDIMEYVGYSPNIIHSTVHTPSGYAGEGDGSSKVLESCEEEFHIYGLLWTENELVFYTDSPENVTHTYSPSTKTEENWPFDQPAFFILNIAIGGTWGGLQGIDNDIFPQSMEVDYVRVYQEQP